MKINKKVVQGINQFLRDRKQDVSEETDFRLIDALFHFSRS